MNSYITYSVNKKCNRRKCTLLLALPVYLFTSIHAQTPDEIINTIKSKLEKINDYTATGRMKTNVFFIRAPVANVKVYYKKPDKLRIVNENGISFIPKGSVNISVSNLFTDLKDYDVIDAGIENDGLHVIKILPKQDTSDIVLSTMYIDAKQMLVMKTKTTTRENGSYELSMTYGKFIGFGLPDKVTFSFNTKDYKLPKGITLDYDEGGQKTPEQATSKRGVVEIEYAGYIVNKGVDDKVFLK